jgi:hypothetical protein
MKSCIFRLTGIGVAILLGGISTVCAQNQTPDVSPILPEDSLPLRISIEQADFSLPSGVQSYVAGTFGGRWLILAGRINGLHGFNNDNSNFPPNQQNSTVFVVDPDQKTVATRSLTAPGSGLTQSQVDLLSVTSAQSYQLGNTLYTILLGGISFGYFANGAFVTDAELPFINQITTIRHGSDGVVSQYLMSSEYPFIASTGSNPGNQLLFGARAHLFAAGRLPAYGNGVLDLDQLGGSQSRVVGYIVGGIMSTLPNTNTQSDSAASPYIFKVTLTST